MNAAFRESFDADLAEITEVSLLRRIKKVIEQVEAAKTFQQIPNLKRLEASTASGWVITASGSSSSVEQSLLCAASIAKRFTGTFLEPDDVKRVAAKILAEDKFVISVSSREMRSEQRDSLRTFSFSENVQELARAHELNSPKLFEHE